jgi:hypothetical protein
MQPDSEQAAVVVGVRGTASSQRVTRTGEKWGSTRRSNRPPPSTPALVPRRSFGAGSTTPYRFRRRPSRRSGGPSGRRSGGSGPGSRGDTHRCDRSLLRPWLERVGPWVRRCCGGRIDRGRTRPPARHRLLRGEVGAPPRPGAPLSAARASRERRRDALRRRPAGCRRHSGGRTPPYNRRG